MDKDEKSDWSARMNKLSEEKRSIITGSFTLAELIKNVDSHLSLMRTLVNNCPKPVTEIDKVALSDITIVVSSAIAGYNSTVVELSKMLESKLSEVEAQSEDQSDDKDE